MLTALSFDQPDIQTNNNYNYYTENEVMVMDNERVLTPEQETDYYNIVTNISRILNKYPDIRVLSSVKFNLDTKYYKADEPVDIRVDGAGLEDMKTDTTGLKMYLTEFLTEDYERQEEAADHGSDRYYTAANIFIDFNNLFSNDSDINCNYLQPVYEGGRWLYA